LVSHGHGEEGRSTEVQIIEAWLRRKSPATQHAYLRELKRFWGWAGIDTLRQVTRPQLYAYADWLAGEGCGAATRNKALDILRSLLTFAMTEGLLSLNPGGNVEREDSPGSLAERYLTPEQVQAIIRAADAQGHGLALRLLYYTGCRVGELAALRWREVLPYGQAGQAVFINTKSNMPRTVNIPASVYRTMEEQRGEPDALVIGRDACTIWRWVKAAALACGLHTPSPHWLRHAHAWHSLERVAKTNVFQEYLWYEILSISSLYFDV